MKQCLVIGIGVALSQQISGDDAVVYYTPKILEQSGFKKRDEIMLWSVLIGSIKVVGIFVGERFLDKRGRRPVIIASLAGMTVFLGLLASFLALGGRPLFAVL